MTKLTEEQAKEQSTRSIFKVPDSELSGDELTERNAQRAILHNTFSEIATILRNIKQ